MVGVDDTELPREALHLHLARLAAEHEGDLWADAPLSDDELALAEIADWGPAEDWSDWSDPTDAAR